VLTDDGSLQITGTPQNLALQTFTTNNPGITLADSEETREFIRTTYALSVLFFSAGGDQWLDRTGWIGAIPPCGNQVTATWFGVSCIDSKVQGIALANNDLVGEIPSEIRGLSSLQSLALESNSLTGTIPVTLGQLSSLTSLDLSTNFLNGTIPVTIDGATSLEVLTLSMNQISGSIPVAVNQMTNLREIALNDNVLEGTLPALTLPSLGKLFRIRTIRLVRSRRVSLTFSHFSRQKF
jgi:Leucine-rich repeat (LRR) protein